MSLKNKKMSFVCNDCGSVANKWTGQCSDCGQWNTMTETVIQKSSKNQSKGYAGVKVSEVMTLSSITATKQQRISSGISELDRALGGGLVSGSVILIGGDPGIGKSTMLLQVMCYLSQNQNPLYITGEESLEQVKLRADRLNIKNLDLKVLVETNVESIITISEKVQPNFIVLDSIQTIYTDYIQSAAGSVSQVRESTAQIVKYAKQTGTTIFLVGHVTKEGALAGPRVLEHMVDTVLYFEGESDTKYRVIRAVKNRFGAVNELGIFAMTDRGLHEVSNPSAIFLSRNIKEAPGSVVLVTWEGTRPMLVEIQALVDDSHGSNPRRVTVGIEQSRLALILAVLNKTSGIVTYNQDIFVNVVGGVKITETGIDLAVLMAVISSLKNQPLPLDLVVFGEVGLSGEVRPVQSGQERLKEALKLGFKNAIVPIANAPKKSLDGINIMPVATVSDLLNLNF